MSDGTKSDEQKTERFNMFMSPSEMEAIDEWAWLNRIRSKSEAVRRLIRIGMMAHHALVDGHLGEQALNFSQNAGEAAKARASVAKRLARTQDVVDWQKAEIEHEEAQRVLAMEQEEIMTAVLGLAIAVAKMSEDGNLPQIAEDADSLWSAVETTVQGIREKREDYLWLRDQLK